MTVSRRSLLATAGAVGGVLAVGLTVDETAISSFPTMTTTGVRYDRIRPLSGGIAITTETSDGTGTLAGGVEGSDGSVYGLTNRHVVDPEFPDGDDDDVLGTTVYQPTTDDGDGAIGTVTDVSKPKGAGASDWALIELEDTAEWTEHVLGLGFPTDTTAPETGDRIVTSGIRTGLHGGEITNASIDRNWRGTLLEDIIEFRVDDDADTAGNSGSWIGTIDSETGAFRPIGVHTFRIDEFRYAIPVSDVFGETDVSLSGSGDTPAAPDSGTFLEGTIGPIADGTATVVVANIGGDPVADRTIELRDSSGKLIDERTIELEPLERTVLEMDSPERPTLSTGDETTEAI